MPKHKSRIGLSSVEPLTWALSAEEWKRLEKLYAGKSFNETIRSEITAAVSEYFKSVYLEENAPFHDEAIKLCSSLQETSAQLLEITESMKRDQTMMSAYVLHRIGRYWTGFGPTSLRNFITLLGEFNVACTFAVSDVEAADLPVAEAARATIKAGDGWRVLVCELTRILSAADLPTGASHGGDTVDTSAFVELLFAIQKTFEEDYRLHMQSKEGLARAINRARSSFTGQ